MTYHSTFIGLDPDEPAPICRLGGADGRSALMRVPDSEVTISVLHMAGTAAYLRTWAASLIALADELDATPVPYALATSPRMPEGMADRGARS